MPRPTIIQQLQLLSEDDLIQFLLGRPEDQWFDRASNRIAARELAQALVAFANAEGGLIAIGIHSERVEGIKEAGPRVNEWRQAALNFTDPPVRHKFETIPCRSAKGEADEIALIEVEASERVHTDMKGETYLRVGDETRRLDPLAAQELRFDKGESIYDGTPVNDLTPNDLDRGLVNKYQKGIKARSEEALQARGLVAVKDGVLRPTIAGALALGSHPQQVFPHAILRLVRYRGSSRETGTRANVIRDRRVEGPLPVQIDTARRSLRRWLPSAIRLTGRGRFEPSTIIPEFAWLEAIVNAVIHRSYSFAGDHIRVEVFEDRVEVQSPGRLPGLVRLENIRSTRFARNPRIARAMNDLGYGRELGEGVNRMFEEMERAGLPDPIFSQGPASVIVVLIADPLANRILKQLPPGAERFVEFLTRHGAVTTRQAAALLDASRPTVLSYLHHLRQSGLIEHMGTSLKDPRGFWKLRRGEPTS